jgi:hypothetical protein
MPTGITPVEVLTMYIQQSSRRIFNPDNLRSCGKAAALVLKYSLGSLMTASVVWWSEFLATDLEVQVRFPALPDSSEK